MRCVSAAIVALGVLLVSCGSKDEPAQQQPVSEPNTQTGTMEIGGTSVQIRWIHDLTETFKSAELAYGLGDTSGAIWTAESLLVVAEGTMDTLPVNAQMTRFLLVYCSDVFASLRGWYAAGGYSEEVKALSQRYNNLAAKMQRRRTADSGQVP